MSQGIIRASPKFVVGDYFLRNVFFIMISAFIFFMTPVLETLYGSVILGACFKFLVGMGFWIALAFAQKEIHKRTLYTINEDGVKIEVRFVMHTVQLIKYESINEVELMRGPFQRQRGLGSILLKTRATGNSQEGHSGGCIRDVENYQEILEKIESKAH